MDRPARGKVEKLSKLEGEGVLASLCALLETDPYPQSLHALAGRDHILSNKPDDVPKPDLSIPYSHQSASGGAGLDEPEQVISSRPFVEIIVPGEAAHGRI